MDAGQPPRPRHQLPAARRRRRPGRVVGGRGTTSASAIEIVLKTERASGCGCPSSAPASARFLFEPNTDDDPAPAPGPDRQVRSPRGSRGSRVESVDVEADPDDPEAAVATITYRLVATQAQERVSLTVALAGAEHARRAPVARRRATTRSCVDEALARIPVHNPEWTNFNRSDPGVTLLELFAFLTESLLYRANQIPERNRREVPRRCSASPLAPGRPRRAASSTLANERGPLADGHARRRPRGARRAGPVPHRSSASTCCPVEARAFFKRRCPTPPPRAGRTTTGSSTRPIAASGRELRTSQLYETAPLDRVRAGRRRAAGDRRRLALDRAAAARGRRRRTTTRCAARARALAGRTLNLGIVPVLADRSAQPRPGRARGRAERAARVPAPARRPAGGCPPPAGRSASPATARSTRARRPTCCVEPGIVQLALPDDGGAARCGRTSTRSRPARRDSRRARGHRRSSRVVTWLRIKAPRAPRRRLLWAGINAVDGHAARARRRRGAAARHRRARPDRPARARARCVAGTVRSGDAAGGGTPRPGTRSTTCSPPAPEVAGPRPAPAARARRRRRRAPPTVFTVDPATGEIRFGDGLHGRRPPAGARSAPTTTTARGRAGNVAPGAITARPRCRRASR